MCLFGVLNTWEQRKISSQDIQNFCTVYLGGYYLDIIKDRLYTTKKNSLARRSCQTSCSEILNFLNLAIAPILSFTSEETFKYYKNDKNTIFLEQWRDIDIELTQDEIDTGKILFELREYISRELENARNYSRKVKWRCIRCRSFSYKKNQSR